MDAQGIGEHQMFASAPGRKLDGHGEAADSTTGLRDQLNMISKTNSQFLSSSYGDEMYYNVGESSEMDDLEDQEVQVISKRQQIARQAANLKADNEAGSDSNARLNLQQPQGQNHLSPDDIRIIIDDEQVEHGEGSGAAGRQRNAGNGAAGESQGHAVSSNGLQQQLQEKNEAQKLTKTANAANSHGFFNYSEEEKKLLDERKLFEGNS
jgi:hypothetical protein